MRLSLLLQGRLCDVGKPIRNHRRHRVDDRLIHKTQKNVLKGGRDIIYLFYYYFLSTKYVKPI